jgi:hypothetical protein
MTVVSETHFAASPTTTNETKGHGDNDWVKRVSVYDLFVLFWKITGASFLFALSALPLLFVYFAISK